MSWILGKAEDLLNKVDQAAGQTLVAAGAKDTDTAEPLTAVVTDKQGYVAQNTGQYPTPGNRSMSVPQISKFAGGNTSSGYLSQTSKSPYASAKTLTTSNGTKTTPAPSSASNNTGKIKRDKDEELFEFLNAPDSDSNGSSNGMKRKPSQTNLSRHSRNSSGSSTFSNKSGKLPDSKSGTDSTIDNVEVAMDQSINDDVAAEILGNADTSSGYHSNHEESGSNEQLSSLELENRLLKNEVTSLNQEMASMIQRIKSSQDELAKVRKKLDIQNQQLSKSDQIVRELRSREGDTQEALQAKDAQIGVLRIRMEEGDKQVKSFEVKVQQLTLERDRVLQDHTSSSGVQSQALDSLKDKLHEAEDHLRREKESAHKAQQEAQERQRKLESEQQSLSEALSVAQRKLTDEKLRTSELNTQLKAAKSQVDIAKQELSDYKDKATRILQSKDKLISSLKDGTGLGSSDNSLSTAELESAKQEITMLKEEIQHGRITTENLRTEVQDLEVQMQQDSETAQEQIQSLEDQLQGERGRREDGDLETTRQKEELRYAHEEMLKQKTGFQSRLQDRESEIERLRNQLTTKSMSSSSQQELENRLHSLTESLIQKQTMMEALSTEKNSLVLQLERFERKYKDLENASSKISINTAVHVTDEDEGSLISAKQRLPGFLKESPGDNEVTRRLKRGYTTLDKFSIRLGVFLRRYPVARVFMFGYMALLHLWVMIVLLTYQPELHGPDFKAEIHGPNYKPEMYGHGNHPLAPGGP